MSEKRLLGASSEPSKMQQLLALDAYSLDTMLPEMDWQALEASLKEAVNCRKPEYSQMLKQSILDSLASAESNFKDERMSSGGSSHGGSSRLSTRLLRPQNTSLQICFLNETSSDSEVDSGGAQSSTTPSGTTDEGVASMQASSIGGASAASGDSTVGDDTGLSGISLKPLTFAPSEKASSNSAVVNPSPSSNSLATHDFVTALIERYALLRQEANIAYAQAARMAVMQLQVEKEMAKYRRKRSAAERMVPGFCEWLQMQNAQAHFMSQQQLRRGHQESPRSPHALQRYLWSHSTAKLQLMLNQMRSDVDGQNRELVSLLEERDDLHTAQDALLVDIEDLSGRLQEKAERLGQTGMQLPANPLAMLQHAATQNQLPTQNQYRQVRVGDIR